MKEEMEKEEEKKKLNWFGFIKYTHISTYENVLFNNNNNQS